MIVYASALGTARQSFRCSLDHQPWERALECRAGPWTLSFFASSLGQKYTSYGVSSCRLVISPVLQSRFCSVHNTAPKILRKAEYPMTTVMCFKENVPCLHRLIPASGSLILIMSIGFPSPGPTLSLKPWCVLLLVLLSSTPVLCVSVHIHMYLFIWILNQNISKWMHNKKEHDSYTFFKWHLQRQVHWDWGFSLHFQ